MADSNSMDKAKHPACPEDAIWPAEFTAERTRGISSRLSTPCHFRNLDGVNCYEIPDRPPVPQLGSRSRPELVSTFVFCPVPAALMAKALRVVPFAQLLALNYDDKRKLTYTVCNYSAIGSGNATTNEHVDHVVDEQPLNCLSSHFLEHQRAFRTLRLEAIAFLALAMEYMNHGTRQQARSKKSTRILSKTCIMKHLDRSKGP